MNANRQQIDYIIRVGIVPPFCDLLSSEYIPTIKVVLEGLQNMLSIISPEVDALVDIIEECGGNVLFLYFTCVLVNIYMKVML